MRTQAVVDSGQGVHSPERCQSVQNWIGRLGVRAPVCEPRSAHKSSFGIALLEVC